MAERTGRVVGFPSRYVFLTRPSKFQWFLLVWNERSGLVVDSKTSIPGNNGIFKGQTFNTVIVDLLHSRWEEQERGDIDYANYKSQCDKLQRLYEEKMQTEALKNV